ncbi:MAG: hypothetical protein D6784_16000 [Chloroflexi bacterium]|nr:MAG: hypothetical protein D6784_16000 [Chloroflexota bacterium]
MNQPTEIKPSSEQLQKIRLLSDEELYRMACQFIAENGAVDSNKQAVSLGMHTQDWDDLEWYVNHQAGRDWKSQKKYAGYKQFFQNLKKQMAELRTKVEKEWFPPPPEYKTRNERKAWVNHFTILVAREFLQHLEAENFYQSRN